MYTYTVEQVGRIAFSSFLYLYAFLLGVVNWSCKDEIERNETWLMDGKTCFSRKTSIWSKRLSLSLSSLHPFTLYVALPPTPHIPSASIILSRFLFIDFFIRFFSIFPLDTRFFIYSLKTALKPNRLYFKYALPCSTLFSPLFVSIEQRRAHIFKCG